MSDWTETTLGEVMALDVNAVEVEPDTSYEIVGVLNRGRGLLYREPILGRSTAYKTLNHIRPGQVVYSRLKAFEGAITVAPNGLGSAYASQEFPTFSCGPRILSNYFALLTTTSRFWDMLQNLSTGMGGRRERVKPKDFLTIQIPLPPLMTQQQIVDIVAAVDTQIDSMLEEVEHAAVALVATRDSLLNELGEANTPLKALTAKIGSGATPRGGETAYVAEGVALIRSQNVYDGHFEWNGLARITDDQAALLDGVKVEPGDVLINITGASVNRVTVVPDAVLPARVNQHVAILRSNPASLDPVYLAHILRRSDLKAELDSLSGSGSTRQALTKAQLEQFKIPIASLDTQREIAFTLNTIVAVVGTLANELTVLRSLRSTLLTALLNQEIEIPDSPDALLSEAVT